MLERDDTRETVREALQLLPEPQREALVLAYWGGLTADQIARQGTCSAGHGEEPSGSAWHGCARNALHSRSTPPRTASLHSNVRSTAELAGTRPGRVRDR